MILCRAARCLQQIIALFALTLNLWPSTIHAQSPASFSLDNHAFEVRCNGLDRPAQTLIAWTSGDEANVFSYKVHRITLSEPAQSRWVNPIPITAMGGGSDYRVVDSSAVPGSRYRYRLYGFEESGRLSQAMWITLNAAMEPSCSYVPVIETSHWSPRSFASGFYLRHSIRCCRQGRQEAFSQPRIGQIDPLGRVGVEVEL